jgi:hypothetical protein
MFPDHFVNYVPDRSTRNGALRLGRDNGYMTSYTDDQVARAFEQTQGHVMEVHARWKLFRKLYRGNADSAPILRAVGGEMFWVLGRLLHRGSLLLFRQLTDGPRSMGRGNASLEGLLEVLAGPGYMTDHPDLVQLINDLRSNTAIRDHVNKYIAHLDLELLLGVADPPSSVGILEFEDALRIMRQFITETRQRFELRVLLLEFEECATLMADQADELVKTLRKGLALTEDQRPAG